MSAMKTTLWGSAFVFIAVLIWSIFSVQVLHPLNQEITKAGVYQKAGCTSCPNAWKSVWQSAITITQHVIAGDSWGGVCVPIIQRAPYTIVIFVAMIFSINLLILNLVLAIVVERANQSHDEDLKLLQAKADKEAAVAQARLLKRLAIMDLDNSGTISKEELHVNFRNDPEVAAQVKNIGVSLKDLDTFFDLMDDEGCGEIPYQQFVQSLYAMKSHDPLQSTIVLARHLNHLKDAMKPSVPIGEHSTHYKLEAAQSSLDQKLEAKDRDGLQHEHNALLFESLSHVVSSIVDECTKLSMMTKRMQPQSETCATQCFDSGTQDFSVLRHSGINHMVQTSEKAKACDPAPTSTDPAFLGFWHEHVTAPRTARPCILQNSESTVPLSL